MFINPLNTLLDQEYNVYNQIILLLHHIMEQNIHQIIPLNHHIIFMIHQQFFSCVFLFNIQLHNHNFPLQCFNTILSMNHMFYFKTIHTLF